MNPQQTKILKAFQEAPGRRLTTSQLAGLYIVRYSARMMELRDCYGCAFTKKHLPDGEWEYRLVSGPDVERDGSRALPALSPQAAVSLSADRPLNRPLNPYEWDLLGEVA